MTSSVSRRLLAPALLLACAVALAFSAAPAHAGEIPPSTPADLVATYSSTADAILALRKAEAGIVRSILETTYGHAQAEAGKARAAMKTGDTKTTQSILRDLASLVSQLGTEGDAAVAGVRKRLLEGGHHHHSSKGEAQGEYEEGFVVVTRAAKIAFLDASKAIGALSLSPNEAGLDTEWKKVQATYSQLMQK